MRFFYLLTLLPAVLTSAFVIPEGTEDGVYAVYTDASGNEVHKRLSDGVSIEKPSKRSSLEARAENWVTACGCGIELNHAYTDDAVQDLKNQVGPDGLNQKDKHYFSIRGDVVAFSCLQDPWWTVTGPNYLTGAFAEITKKCGWYIAGTTQREPEGAEPAVAGYMRWSPGLDFCANAYLSPLTHC